MALRAAKPVTFRPVGLTDAVDGSNAFPGAMQALQNLIPSVTTKYCWVPRPAAQELTTFPGFTTPGFISALLTVGNIAYGMIASGLIAGHDQPFAYNFSTNTFLTISGINSANTPTSPATSGDWTPPVMAQVGSRIVVTHPGFSGAFNFFYFGWFDVSGFTSTGITGSTTSGGNTISSLSTNVLQAGWQVGMTISGAGIPAGSTINTIASNGLSVAISQILTATATGVALTVAGGTATAPLWNAGNLNGAIQFSAPPVSVAQFNGRAWYATAPSQASQGISVVFSDSGLACQATNATQGLAFRNGLPVTALAPLPLNSPLTGGQIQAIIAFQADSAIWQITGDITTSNLSTNALNVATGTLSPLSIASTPKGVMFVAPDGVRMIDFSANVSNPIGANGQGVSLPFINVLHPSRTTAAFNQNVYRCSVQNPNANGSPVQEYWYDFNQQIWSGPHTFPAAQIQPMQGSVQSFLMAANGINAALWQSDVLPTDTESYTENGNPMSWVWQTSLLPDNEQGAANAIVEATLALNYGSSLTYTLQALDEAGNVLDTLMLTGPMGIPTLWGTATWGAPTLWLGAATAFAQVRLDWHQPIVFKQMSIRLSGQSVANLVVGNLYLKYQILGYILQTAS